MDENVSWEFLLPQQPVPLERNRSVQLQMRGETPSPLADIKLQNGDLAQKLIGKTSLSEQCEMQLELQRVFVQLLVPSEGSNPSEMVPRVLRPGPAMVGWLSPERSETPKSTSFHKSGSQSTTQLMQEDGSLSQDCVRASYIMCLTQPGVAVMKTPPLSTYISGCE